MRGSRTLRGIADWPFYPVLLGAAYVIGVFASAYFPIAWLVRPLLVTVACIAALELVLTLIARDRHVAAAIAGVAIALAATGVSVPLIVVLIGVVGWQVAAVVARKPRPSLRPGRGVTRSLNVLSGVWLVVATGFAMPSFLAADHDVRAVVSAITVDPNATVARPDIYVILLDAYARSDTLAQFGFDDEAFLGSLEARGFDVYRDSVSNYPETILSVPSILQMQYTHDFSVPIPSGPPEQDRVVWENTNRSAAIGLFRQLGYEIYSTAAHSAPAELRDVDHYLDHGNVNEFEGYLLQGASEIDVVLSIVARNWLPEQHRSHVLSNFADLDQLAGQPNARPRFVWAHVMSPHAPLVFHADGSLYPPPSCFPFSCNLGAGDAPALGLTDFVKRYTEQVAYLNTRVSKVVDEILAHDAGSVILILSDHGSRYDPAADDAERFHNLFAAHTPGHPELYQGFATPVNALRLLFGAYFDAQAPPI
jgi:hypothetical protein